MSAHRTSTEEKFEIVKFVENIPPFAMLQGKTWIEKDQIRRKQEEEDLEHKKQELRDFMARIIAHVLEEKENHSKLLKTKDMNVEVERTQEYWRHLSEQKSREPTPEREEVLPLNLMKDPPQCEVIMARGDKNDNGKRRPVIQITGKKTRKLIKKREKLEKLQEAPERTLQKEGLHNLNFVDISTTQIGTSPWQSNMTIGGIMTIRSTLPNG
jgi:hypothetical protein